MTIDLAYSQWAATYDDDRNLTRDLDRTVTAQVLNIFTHADKKARLIVEAGCGTGKNTPFFAALADRVLAMDFSSGMLERARANVNATNVSFREANLLKPWPCESASASLVSCNLVLEHIEDMTPVFAEAARVLTPGGCFFVSELHPFKQYRGSQARFVDAAGDTVPITAYRHHVSDFVRITQASGFSLERLDEWWHDEDVDQPPRLLTLLLRKTVAAAATSADLAVTVVPESPDHPDIVALVAELDAYQTVLYPPDSNYTIDLTALAPERVHAFVARDARGDALGCGALVLRPGYGEIKRMYVRPEARGRGIAKTLLEQIERAARATGCARLFLETGVSQPEAIGLYGRQGYTRCERFGDYPDNVLSVYMQKRLIASDVADRH